MAQRSLPQAGDETVTPAYVDAGPYTADEWAEYFRIVFTTDQQATQGVLRGYLNELEPTSAATRTLYVNTGAGIVNGHLLINDASVTIAVDAGAARNDALVMLENNSNAAISAGAATNYNTEGNADIPPYSARLAVVKDVAANFSQTNTLYMVQLATFTTGAGAFTNFTDVREYCQFANVAHSPLWIPVAVGWNTTDGADIALSAAWASGSSFSYLPLADSKQCIGLGSFIVPDTYRSNMIATPVIIPLNASGNVYAASSAQYGACDELYSTHSDSGGAAAAYAIVDQYHECIVPVTLSSVAVGDIVHLRFIRDATNVLDTVSATVALLGWYVSYS